MSTGVTAGVKEADKEDRQKGFMLRAVSWRPSGPVLGLLAVLALFVLLLAGRGGLGNLLSVRNPEILSHKSSIPAVVALGMLLVMITGGIDLSVGSIVAL